MIKLFPYQEEGVKAYSTRTANFDDCGLGKSIQTLYYIQQNPELRPCVICCPSSLKLNWQKEARDKFYLDSLILYGERPYKLSPRDIKRLLIINYDILQYWLGYLRSLGPKLIAGDECHLLGNLQAKRTRAFRLLCKGVSNIIILGATPFTNQVFELFPMLNLLWPEDFASPWAFGLTYCDAEKSRGRWTFKGSRNLLELNQKLKELGMIRRTKEEVLTQLPPVITSVVPLEIEDLKQYKEAETDLVSWLIKTYSLERAQKSVRAQRFTKFTYLKHLAAQLKLKSVIEYIDILLGESKEKILVCVIHKDITQRLKEKYDNICVVINGDVSEGDRQVAEREFQTNPKIRIMFGQIKTTGIGLNLTAGSIALFVELHWNAALHQQFTGRLHRIGQTNKVRAIFLVAAGTIEEKLCKLIQSKETSSNYVLDGIESRISSLNIFDLLQQELTK